MAEQFRNESEFVGWLRPQAARKTAGLTLGIGDDAALIRVAPRRELILTADLSIEGVHFLHRLHTAFSVGHRALARSLSDLAAMGGTPRFALISLAISHRTTRAWVEEFYRGLLALADRFGVALVGGDTAVVPAKTLIDVTVAGEIERGRALVRSGARPGDALFVSGRLGLSALGLRWLKARGAPRPGRFREPLRAHLFPEPRCALGRFLAERRLASAVIDLSDGLSTDLRRLSEASGVGARIWADRLPLAEVSGEARPGNNTLRDLALHGGEDYELLFSVPARKALRIPARYRGVALHRIGEVCGSKEILLVLPGGKEVPFEPAGYDHFRKNRR